MLERLRDQLLYVHELSVDATRGQHDVADAKHDLILVHADLELALPTRDAAELCQRTRRDNRLERGCGGVQLRLLYGEPI